MHNMKLSYKCADGSVKLVTTAPGLFQVFLWNWRIKENRLKRLEAARANPGKVIVTVDELNRLDYLNARERAMHSDSEGFISEAKLVKLLGYPDNTKVVLQGYGNLKIPVHVRVSECTVAADSKVRDQGGEVRSARALKGKRRASERADYQAHYAAKKAKNKSKGMRALRSAGFNV